MLFPFMAGLFTPRNVTAHPSATYVPVRATSDDNAVNAFETLQGPPNLDIVGRGYGVAQSPGPAGALFLPSVEYPSQPSVGSLQTASFVGGNGLFNSTDSAPEQELF